MQDVFVTAVVFYGFYMIIRVISEHFLKRKIINSGNFEKAGILSSTLEQSEEVTKYPSLKWGLVALMAGLGLIIIEVIRYAQGESTDFYENPLPFGIELVFIALGFLIYFFILNSRKK